MGSRVGWVENDLTKWLETISKKQIEDDRNVFKSISAPDFLNLQVPPRDFIVEPFLPERGLIEIYARTGVGKTTFALALAVAAASSTSFFNWKVSRPWKLAT